MQAEGELKSIGFSFTGEAKKGTKEESFIYLLFIYLKPYGRVIYLFIYYEKSYGHPTHSL